MPFLQVRDVEREVRQPDPVPRDALGRQLRLEGEDLEHAPARLDEFERGPGRLSGRDLDALTLGEDSAASLGLNLARARLLLVTLLALCTGLAVSQAGLVAFVGLVAPHLVRRYAPSAHGYLLAASSATGGVLLLGADVLARALIAPQELPVGVVTAVLGGGYLLWLLQRRALAA